MGATATRMTVEEYFAVSVEGDRTQLVDGAIVVSEPKLLHVELQGRIYFEMRTWIQASKGRGIVFLPTNVVIDDHNVFAPDVIWFAEAHRPRDLAHYPERLPDMCVEVRSPGTWRYDVGARPQ